MTWCWSVEMVLVMCGSHAVDKASQICQLYFYVETYPGSSTYTREHHGRRALETVLWDSILDLAKGEWNGSEWNSS